jgi:hypothetical protein
MKKEREVKSYRSKYPFGTAVGPLGFWRFFVERRNIGEPSHRSSMWAVATVTVITTIMSCLLSIAIVM